MATIGDDGRVVYRELRDNNADMARKRGRVKRRRQAVHPVAEPPTKRSRGSDNGASDDSMPSFLRQPSTHRASTFQQQPVHKHVVVTAKARARAKAKAIEAQQDEAFLSSWRERLDSRPTTKPVVSGATRMQALLAQVRGRSEA